jgi:hypothetical protein
VSRGLGTLQRAILEAIRADQAILEAICADPAAWRGRYRIEDLRTVVARRLGRFACEERTRSFAAAVSRARRTLGARGLIRYDPYLGGLVRVSHEPDKR